MTTFLLENNDKLLPIVSVFVRVYCSRVEVFENVVTRVGTLVIGEFYVLLWL